MKIVVSNNSKVAVVIGIKVAVDGVDESEILTETTITIPPITTLVVAVEDVAVETLVDESKTVILVLCLDMEIMCGETVDRIGMVFSNKDKTTTIVVEISKEKTTMWNKI
jgi:hypothetical protein